MKQHILTTIAGAFLFCTLASAGNETIALPFMEIDQNPSTSGMAGACALHSPATSDVFVSYNRWSPVSTSYFNAAADLNIGDKMHVKVFGGYGAGKTVEFTSGIGAETTQFKPSDMLIGAGVSYSIIKPLSVEVDVRYASSKFAPLMSTGAFAVDILAKGYVNGFKYGAGATNIGPSVGGNNIPSAALVALGYDNGADKEHRIDAEVDAKYFFCGSFGLSAGAAYTFKDLVSVRAGYHFGGVIADHASVGIGVKLIGIHLDASYLIGTGVIRNTFAVGLGYSF